MQRRAIQRRCIICRRPGGRWELLRFVMRDGALIWDESGCAAGRGAYVHRTLACWSKMAQAGPFEHALRLTRSTIDATSLRAAQQAARSAVPDPGVEEGAERMESQRAGGKKVRL